MFCRVCCLLFTIYLEVYIQGKLQNQNNRNKMSGELRDTTPEDSAKCQNNDMLISSLPNLESKVLDKYPFKVGRSHNCDLIIIDPLCIAAQSISKEHFIVTKNLQNNETFLTDISKNGTYINGKRAKKHTEVPLRDGTKIGFGLSTANVFTFRNTQDDLPITLTPLSVSDSEETRVQPPWGRLITCMLYIESIDLTQLTFKVGKTSECDLKIDDTNLKEGIKNIFSREHFSIFKDPDHPIVYIKDHSRFGTYLNGILIGKNKMHILQDKDVISIGKQQLDMFIYRRMFSVGLNDLPSELQSRYEIVQLIGKGAAGEVLLAFGKTTCEMVAIKKIAKAGSALSQKHKLNHPDKIECEVNILKTISHPFVINMKDVVETPNKIFIVLEYMKGGELSKRIFSHIPMTEDNIKVLFCQIAEAIEFLHFKGITHRDLKPQNVLLETEDPETLVKVSDFGLSKINDEESTMKTFCGTLHYIAPELFNGKYKKQADIWSLGVILFYMLSKELPFGNNKKELCSRIKNGRYSMDSGWDNVSEEAIDLVKKMLIVQPEKRIGISDILKHPWLATDIRIKIKVERLKKNNLVNPMDIIAPHNTNPPPKRIRLQKSEENSL